MQKLQFESAWDKTIAAVDRERIHQVFLETSLTNERKIELTPLWEAINHKGELLVTVLVHNFGEESFSFDHKTLRYVENKKLVAEHIFNAPTPTLKHETSMPWTFIFPARSLLSHPQLENGHVELTE